MTTKVWVPISVCPRGSCWLPRPVSAHSWFLPCLPPQSAVDGEEAVWCQSSDLGGGDYLFRVSKLADRWKDECVCFVCTDIIQKIIDRHLEAMGHNQELLVHLIWQISQKRNKKLTCGWEEYDFLIITEQSLLIIKINVFVQRCFIYVSIINISYSDLKVTFYCCLVVTFCISTLKPNVFRENLWN